MIQAHPLGVKPAGNALLDPDYSRTTCMGQLGLLTDTVLAVVLQELSFSELLALSHTSKALFAYCWFDELWKHHVYQGKVPSDWFGSWRKTALRLEKEAEIDASGKVYSDFLFRPYELSQIDYREHIKQLDLHPISRFSESELSPERFAHGLYRRPFIAQLSRPIAEWSMESLVNKFGDELFRQEYMEWPLKLYAQYMKKNLDETPLYLFDCKSAAHKALHFEVPLKEAFGDDHFTLFGEDRPDHQWLIIGPKSSGSSFHKDPNATSAWNSVVSGQKYWIMFPPQQPPPGVWTDAEQSEVTAPVSLAEWFCSGFYDEALETKGFCHAITKPGECMYVPSGWWHAVANLDESIAMTGNFVPKPQLDSVLAFLRDKPGQISGFKRPEHLYEKFSELLHKKGVEHVTAKKRKRIDSPPTESPFVFSFSI